MPHTQILAAAAAAATAAVQTAQQRLGRTVAVPVQIPDIQVSIACVHNMGVQHGFPEGTELRAWRGAAWGARRRWHPIPGCTHGPQTL